MSDTKTPFGDALGRLGTSGDGLTVTAEKNKQDTEVSAEVSVSPGKWTMSAAWAYTKDLGNSALGKITWRP